MDLSPNSPDHDSDALKLLRRNRELAILNTIAEALNRSIELQTALESVLSLVADLLDLRTGWIWLVNRDAEESITAEDFYAAAARELPPLLADDPERMSGSCLCLDEFCAGKLRGAANIDVLACSRLWGQRWGTEGLRYHATIPIYVQDRPLGVMNVASPEWRSFEPEELQLLYTIGNQLGVAIERSRYQEESRQLAAMEERNRLARELHDTLAQGLTAIALNLEAAEALVDTKPERARQKMRRALELAQLNLAEARRSVLDLRAAPLEGRTLPQALADLIIQQAREHGPALSFRVTQAGAEIPYARSPALSARLEAGLYRIVQEALANAVQHSQAQRIDVELAIEASQVTVTVGDDGIGFDATTVTTASPAGHFGLVGLAERARLLEGRLEIHSYPGAGTRVQVAVPR